MFFAKSYNQYRISDCLISISNILVLWFPNFWRFKSILSQLEIIIRLFDFPFLIHAKRTFLNNRFVQWLSCKQNKSCPFFNNVEFQIFVFLRLLKLGSNIFFYHFFWILSFERSIKNIDYAIPLFWNQMRILSIFLMKSEIYPINWLFPGHCSPNIINLTRHNLCCHNIILICWNFLSLLFLDLRITVFMNFWKINP
jgi:hypothetical protein